MRLKMLLISIVTLPLLAFIYTSCTKGQSVGCAVEDAAVTTVSGALSGGLSCANKDAVTAWVKGVADKTNICTQAQGKQKLDPVICSVLVGAVVAEAGAQIPADWQCTPTVASATVKSVLAAACSVIPGP